MADTKAAEEVPRVEEEAKVCRRMQLPPTLHERTVRWLHTLVFRHELAQQPAAAAAAAATDAATQAAAQPACGDAPAMTNAEKVTKAKEIVTQQVTEAKSAMDKVKSLFGAK